MILNFKCLNAYLKSYCWLQLTNRITVPKALELRLDYAHYLEGLNLCKMLMIKNNKGIVIKGLMDKT
jgi:hypothetical protein